MSSLEQHHALRNVCVYLIGTFYFSALGAAQTATTDDGWKNLARISHSSSMTFVMRDGACVSGPILSVDGSSVTIQRYNQNSLTITKRAILQVGEGGPHNLIYSGRSSWNDATHIDPGHAESFLIVMRGGKKYSGKAASATGTMIELRTSMGTTKLPKQDVLTVDYMRQKPLTDNEEYFAQEAPFLLIFSPMSYVRAAGISSKLNVRVYNASQPEDNSEVTCRPVKSKTP